MNCLLFGHDWELDEEDPMLESRNDWRCTEYDVVAAAHEESPGMGLLG
jgi:hypothetical protein